MILGFILGVVFTLLVLGGVRLYFKGLAQRRGEAMMVEIGKRRYNSMHYVQYMFASKGVFLSELPSSVSKGVKEELTVTEFSITQHWHPRIKDDAYKHALFIELSDPYESYEIQKKGELNYNLTELTDRKGFQFDIEPVRDFSKMSRIILLVTTRGPMTRRPTIRSMPEKILVDAIPEESKGKPPSDFGLKT